MITLEKIHISNFRAFREKEFDFENKALILLTAPNGFGKTSLVDAIEWCLTGTIRRLRFCYEDRTDKEVKNLKKGLIINCNAGKGQACVRLMLQSNESEVFGQIAIERSTENDDLESENTHLKVSISDKEYFCEDAEILLGKIINTGNFYNYHVCDVQKAFRFLSSNREDTYKQFADFITDYKELDAVIDNLSYMHGQLKSKVTKNKLNCEQLQTTIKELDNSISELSKRINFIEYDKSTTIYDGEILDISHLQKNALADQLRNLNLCLFKIVYDLKKEIAENNEKIEVTKKIGKLISELQINGEAIKHAIDSGYTASSLTETRNKLSKFEEIPEITKETFSQYYGEVLSMNPVSLNPDAISEYEKNKKHLKEELNILEHKIHVASEGNEIMKLFSDLLSMKSVFIDYRDQGRSGYKEVCCPVCGNEKFGTLPDANILARAKEYCDNQNAEIAKMSAKKADIEKNIKEIWEKELVQINAALKEVKETLNKKVNYLSKIDDFIKMVKEINEHVSEKFELAEISIESLNNRLQLISKDIKSEEDIDTINRKANIIIMFINDQDKLLGIKEDGPITYYRELSEKAPKILVNDIEHICRKIDSLKIYLNCSDYTEKVNLRREKDDAKRKLADESKQIGEVCSYIESKVNTMRTYKINQTDAEYREIMGYLYHIFKKLCRNSDIKTLENDSGKGMRKYTLTLKDGDGNPIQNIMSDGQLSVFMLSVFFSNAKRIANDKNNSEKLHCYFIDDITSCMDDINMLAFVDFIKYQTVGENRCMDQLFFSTCDARIRKLIMYKCKMAGVDFCEISADKF